jgi:hypothetical protein
MATYNLRRFSKPDLLRKIELQHLTVFLLSHGAKYFADRGLDLSADEQGDINYDKLSSILQTPDSSTPDGLAEALFYVNELSTSEGFDAIQEAIANTELDVQISEDAAHADLVIQVWMADQALVERLHAEQFLFRPRSFEYFCTKQHSVPKFAEPSKTQISALESELDDWFAKKRRGRSSKVFVFVKSDYTWFLVRHGEPFTRESTIKDGESSSVYYRPEKYDVLIYNPDSGEIRMNAKTKGEKELYRTSFGLHFFGDKEFFDGRSKFSLDVLSNNLEDALLCDDIDGMDWVKLKEIQVFRGGPHKEIEIRKAEDLFAVYNENEKKKFPQSRIFRATMQVKFSDAKSARSVSLSTGNKAQFKRDDDAEILEEWMVRRGFIVAEEASHDK